MIRSKGFPPGTTATALFDSDGRLKAHPAYKQAKAGDKDAALEVVVDLAVAWVHGALTEYVLVDDVTSLGGTLAELSNYIQVFGGAVKGVVVVVNAGRNPALAPKKHFIQLIKERFDDEFTDIFGIEPGALTANEAQYLAGFRSVDAIRNRLAAAEQEIDRRLRSKGIARAPKEASVGARADEGLSPYVPGADDEAR